MRILKHGNPPDTAKRFTCRRCGCEFEAVEGEYEAIRSYPTGVGVICADTVCNCPECGQLTNESKEGV